MLRNILLGIALLGLAYAFFANQDLFLSDNTPTSAELIVSTSAEGEEENETGIKPEVELPKEKEKIKSKNSAADGLSNFYASIRADMDDDGPKIINNVVFLPDPQGSLEKILEARRMVTRPLKKTWKGTKENRPFRKGETLFQKLAQYANDDGLEVIWWINRDLVVKDAFRINKTVIRTTYQIGKALEGHFPDGLRSYFCYQQRALVLVEGPMEYLSKECTELKSRM